jgi:hypothetical protein
MREMSFWSGSAADPKTTLTQADGKTGSVTQSGDFRLQEKMLRPCAPGAETINIGATGVWVTDPVLTSQFKQHPKTKVPLGQNGWFEEMWSRTTKPRMEKTNAG